MLPDSALDTPRLLSRKVCSFPGALGREGSNPDAPGGHVRRGMVLRTLGPCSWADTWVSCAVAHALRRLLGRRAVPLTQGPRGSPLLLDEARAPSTPQS